MKWKSDKAQRLNRVYDLVKKASLKAMPHCVRCGHSGSKANPLTTDHIQNRTGVNVRRVKLLVAPTNLQTLCLKCHKWVTANRKRSDKLDYRAEAQKEAMATLEAFLLNRLPPIPESSMVRWTDGDLHIAMIGAVDAWCER